MNYEDYAEMYVKLIIFIIHQLLTILENWYLGSYWALNNGSPLIFYLMDIITLFPFSKFFAKIFDSQHLVRFLFAHPLYSVNLVPRFLIIFPHCFCVNLSWMSKCILLSSLFNHSYLLKNASKIHFHHFIL